MATEADTVSRIERFKVAAVPAAVRIGRHFTRGVLERRQIGQSVIEDAEIIVSELVSNAVKATAAAATAAGTHHQPMPPVTIEVELADNKVRIAVEDSSSEQPVRQRVDDDAENGRGLLLVEFLSARWGVCFTVDGKTTWAELTLVPVPVT